MNNFLLLFVLCLLFHNSKCGPDIFKFTSQPVSKTVNPGGTVTLSCVATGRTGITYSWYKLGTGFSTPPSENDDLISGATETEYVVDAADVDESGEDNLFQCKATAGEDVILSNVVIVKYNLADDIKFNEDSYSGSFTTSDDEPDIFVYKLSCNPDVGNIDTAIENGKPYDVYWFKDSESTRVEDTYTNMWTYYSYNVDLSESLSVNVGGSSGYTSVSKFKRYDLVIFNVQTTDTGTYYCKAVSRGNKESVVLGTSTLTVSDELNDYAIKSEDIMGGYVVLAVDDLGKRKSTINVGDEVLLMCGAACRTSDGSWDIQYTWEDNSGTVLSQKTNEITVIMSSSGTVNYNCKINSECGSPSAKRITFQVNEAAEIIPLLPFTFSTTPPEYMWYDTSDNSKSDDPFEINCDGSVSSGSATFLKHMFKKGALVSSTLPYTFDSDMKSERSGVYQCGLYNDPLKMTWYQNTTNVIIASDPTSSITPTSKSVEDGTSATFTCTVGGYPIESVTISGPNSVNTFCPQTSGDVTCSSIVNTSKYEITVAGFSSAKNGDYTCTVQTRWYKTDSTDMGKVSSDKIKLQYVKASTTELTASKTSANKGDSITLTCVVEGYPEPIEPTLTKKGSVIAWTSTCTGTNVKKCLKTFSSPTYSDSGKYLCEGSNTIDGVSKTSDDDVDLTIVGDVEASLVQSPSGTELDKDSSVTYTCKVEGNALPTKLTFKKGNVALKLYVSTDSSSHADVVKETYSLSYTYKISSLTLEDSAVYTCEGENDNSGKKTDDDTKTLTVVSDVIVTLSASTDTPSIGDTFTITCIATGGRKPKSVELKHDSISIKSYPTNSGFCSSTGPFSLKCTYTTTADYTSGGKYECIGKNNVANNKEVTTTKSIDVSVSQTVEVSMTPSSESEVPTGTGFTITCHVKGGDQPHKVILTKPDSTEITWQRVPSSGDALICNGNFQLSCEYAISNPDYTDEGQYQCDGYNKLPNQDVVQTNSASVSLVLVKDVEVTLTDTLSSNLNEVYFGTPFAITCVADGGRIPFYLKLDCTPHGSSTASEIVLYNKPGKTPTSVAVNEQANTLTYVHSVTSSGYNDDGTYKCLSKNKAASEAEKENVKPTDIIVVKNVTSSISNLGNVSKGSQLTISCTAEGNRPPHNIVLEKDGSPVMSWSNPASQCTVLYFYRFECVYDVQKTDYSNGGTYNCVSKNKALEQKEVSSSSNSAIAQISRSVLTVLNPNSETELLWDSPSIRLTCNIEGGLQPHKATLDVPGGTTFTWTREPSSATNALKCDGDHEVECVHEVTSATFDNTGMYDCTGFNKLPDSSAEEKTKESVEVIVVKDVEATLTSSSTSDEVDFGSELNLTCKVEGGRTPFFLLLDFDDGSNVVKTIIEYDDTDQSDTDQSNMVTREKNSLEYVHTIDTVVYDNNGSYKCTGKNKALKNEEKTNKSIKNAVVVKDVEIAQINDFDTDFGSSFTFDFTLNGGRPPHLVSLKKGNQQIRDINMCTGTNEMTCSSTIGDSDVDFEYDGAFTVTAENRAKNDALKTTTVNFTITVYKEVTATISPSLDSKIAYNEDITIKCEVEGGLPPHQVDLILPNQDSMTWTKNGLVTDLTCSGEHELVCKYAFKPEYDSDGEYKCKGYNEVRSVKKVMESSAVTLTTVRKTQVNVPEEPISVLTNEEIKIDCIIVGKPLVDKSSVTWTHSTDLDLSEFVDTVKGNQDDFTLNSTLTVTNPLTTYTGTFKCNVANGEITISGAVEVFIANKKYLEYPTGSHTGGEFSEEGSQITVTCRVEGFPAPSASLTYEKQDGTLPTILSPESSDPISTTLTEFVFSVTTTCDYAKYNFSCNAQNMISSQSTLISGPTITGCENPLPVILGGGIGGGVVFIVIIAVVVFFILRRIKVNKDRSYTPKNGAEFPNPTFVADPTYATVGDSNQVGATGGYSHLNRPAGETDEEGYACIGQLKPGTANVHPTGEDAYATLDTTSNGMLGLRRQGSNETYAALNRPAPGKAKRGVISKYKPMSNKPKTFGMPPNKPATDDIEMGETSHGGQPDPTYATVNPQTLKSKVKASSYADVTLPDLPPEVPMYGTSSQRSIPSEYADVTVAPPQTPYNMADRQRPILSEYADVTLPGPPEVLYSNMANRQDNTPEEDPVYAQVDLKNRTLPQRRVEEEEDLPPDVPVYGTIGQLTEPDSPDFEDEDPYATVEFVPKSKRKPPRPKPKENASEGVYATITDIKENL